MKKIPVNVVRMYPDVLIPKYQTKGSAGCDVHAYLSYYPCHEVEIPFGETAVIPTGLRFAVPDGWEMQIRPRSGLSSKTKLRIANSPGTLDGDYRGELKIIVDNTSNVFFRFLGFFGIVPKPIVIKNRDRISQLIIAEVAQADFKEVDVLDETERGSGGFGSTDNARLSS